MRKWKLNFFGFCLPFLLFGEMGIGEFLTFFVWCMFISSLSLSILVGLVKWVLRMAGRTDSIRVEVRGKLKYLIHIWCRFCCLIFIREIWGSHVGFYGQL